MRLPKNLKEFKRLEKNVRLWASVCLTWLLSGFWCHHSVTS